MLTKKIKQNIDASVLCWLATSDTDGQPNVSPKELFTYSDDGQIIIANIASPQSVKNIKANQKVCVSFIDVLLQKGYQVKGTAKLLLLKNDSALREFECLQKLAGDKFIVRSLIQVQPLGVKEIIAPSYQFYPETSEESMIAQAKIRYNLNTNDDG